MGLRIRKMKITNYKIQCPCIKKIQGPYQSQIKMPKITDNEMDIRNKFELKEVLI